MDMEKIWQLPKARSVYEVRLDDHTVTAVRRHGNPDGTRIVMCHGIGLAIDLYYPFWSLLMDDFDLFVYDLRNHGWNATGPRTMHTIPTLVCDQDRVVAAIHRLCGSRPTVGLYHSLSAVLSLLPSLNSETVSSPHRVHGLAARLLFDPPIHKPMFDDIALDVITERHAAVARRRMRRFQSREAYARYLSRSQMFESVVPGVIELMTRTTLRRSADRSGYELRCPPEYEAQILQYVRSYSALIDLSTCGQATKVIGADPTLPTSYLPTFNADEVEAIEYDFIPESGHLLLLENPAECASLAREFIARIPLGIDLPGRAAEKGLP